ncbi:hypothetical protein [Streptomyces sp. NPDC088674]|uniref:hypothetical protein n=1 Tax=Streptomyces sp. NPDC088674 TaxID=3365869 RepID=UPI0037FB64D1
MSAALDAQYGQITALLRSRLLAFVTAAFQASGAYRDADAAAFVEQVLPTVLGAQAQMGALTDAYLSQTIGAMLGTAATPAGVSLPEALRGVAPEEVYARPYRTVWSALAAGKSMTQAVAEGTTRLSQIASTDLQLARTSAAQQVGQARGGFSYYRRVLRGSYNCALCTIASTQRYSKERLMPIHPGCDCGIAPIPPGQAAQQVIDPGLLQAAHDAVAKGVGRSDAGGRAPDYRDVIVTREHGEIGPLLAVRRQNFTGPAQVPDLPGTAA